MTIIMPLQSPMMTILGTILTILINNLPIKKSMTILANPVSFLIILMSNNISKEDRVTGGPSSREASRASLVW